GYLFRGVEAGNPRKGDGVRVERADRSKNAHSAGSVGRYRRPPKAVESLETVAELEAPSADSAGRSGCSPIGGRSPSTPASRSDVHPESSARCKPHLRSRPPLPGIDAPPGSGPGGDRRFFHPNPLAPADSQQRKDRHQRRPFRSRGSTRFIEY